MKADPDDQMRLLDLQAIDTALDRLAHRRKTLPEVAEIECLTGEQRTTRDDLVRAQTAVGDLDREQRKLEVDIDQVRTRSERDQQRMQVSTSAREAENLEHEIGSLARRLGDLEDQLLELMVRREESDAALAGARSGLESLGTAYTDAVTARDKAFAEIDADAVEQQGRRSSVASGGSGELLARYERSRTNGGGIGAARLYRHRCEGCHLELSGGDLEEVRAAPADEVVFCPECGRILVRTPESGL